MLLDDNHNSTCPHCGSRLRGPYQPQRLGSRVMYYAHCYAEDCSGRRAGTPAGEYGSSFLIEPAEAGVA